MGTKLENARGYEDASRAVQRGSVNEGEGYNGNDEGAVRGRLEARKDTCGKGDNYSCGVAKALQEELERLVAGRLEKAEKCRNRELRSMNREICGKPTPPPDPRLDGLLKELLKERESEFGSYLHLAHAEA